MKKQELIKEIKNHVKKHGQSLSMGELEAETSPLHASRGNQVDLVEYLFTEQVTVVTYANDREVDEYNVAYEDLKKSTLKEIKELIDLAEEFELIEED